VFLGLTMFAIAVLATTLLGRRAIVAMGAVSVIALIGGLVFAARQPSITGRTVAIHMPGGVMDQRDEWTFRTTAESGPDEWKSAGDMDRPIFAGQADDLEMWTELSGDGPVFHYKLQRGQKIAFVRRVFIPPMKSNDAAQNFGWTIAEPSSFDSLIRKFYLKPGERIEVPASKSGNPPSEFLVRVP